MLKVSDMEQGLKLTGSHIERIFIDGSHTVPSGKNTGIERVVRSLLANGKQAAERLSLPIPQLVTQYNGDFFQANSRVLRYFRWLARIEANPRSFMPAWYVRGTEAICRTLGLKTLRKWILPQSGHLGLLKLPHSLCNHLARSSMRWGAKPIAPTANDLFILPDAYWTQRNIWEAAADARSRGATVASVIYDLIPLTHPDFVGKKRSEGFRKYLHQTIENSDLLVAISKTVKLQVEEYIREHRATFQNVPSKVSHFVLGAELELKQGAIRPTVQEVFSQEKTAKTFLMVATFDPRKNHGYVLDAFERLWEQGQDVQLCLVGRVGALCDDLIRRIHEHPAFGKQLFVFHDMQDAELHYCYQNCSGVLLPSTVEGFGLPIVESLWFGKATYASNTTIHREVGRDACVYFELDDPQSLVDLILPGSTVVEEPNREKNFCKPFSWSDSTTQLLEICCEFRAARSSAPSAFRQKVA